MVVIQAAQAWLTRMDPHSAAPMRPPRGLQTPKISADGPKSSRLADLVNPESSSLARRFNVCDFGVIVDNSAQASLITKKHAIV